MLDRLSIDKLREPVFQFSRKQALLIKKANLVWLTPVRNQQNRLLNKMKTLYSVFDYFLNFSISLSHARLCICSKSIFLRVRILFFYFGIYGFTQKYRSLIRKSSRKIGSFWLGICVVTQIWSL